MSAESIEDHSDKPRRLKAVVGSHREEEEAFGRAYDPRVIRRIWAFVRPYRAKVGLAVVAPAALFAAAVPWGLAAAQPACAEPPLVLTTINLSLNAFFAILLWARSRWSWLLVAPALAGVLALDLLPGVGCPLQGNDILLSSAILIPAALERVITETNAPKLQCRLLAEAANGFSGAEIEQAVVSALYAAHAAQAPVDEARVLEEVRNTRPLSVLMAEQVNALRDWARSRTVPAD